MSREVRKGREGARVRLVTSAATIRFDDGGRKEHDFDMEPQTALHNPFAVLTFIVAPALLTNASCLLALSTANRMLRARERMHGLFEKSEKPSLTSDEQSRLRDEANRVEKQSLHLLKGLRSIYVALGGFVLATFVTLLGASLAQIEGGLWFPVAAFCGMVLGGVGVCGMVNGSYHLFQATQISMVNIREEAEIIRVRHHAE